MSDEFFLSQFETQELRKFYEEEALPEFIKHNEEDAWYGIMVGHEMFDINIWRDDMSGNVSAVVYPCVEVGDNWETHTRDGGVYLTDVREG